MRFTILLCAVAGLAAAEPKIWVFITESGAMLVSVHSMSFTGPTSAESIEVMKALQQHCPAVAVFNKDADLVFAQSNRTLAPVVKGACAAVMAKK